MAERRAGTGGVAARWGRRAVAALGTRAEGLAEPRLADAAAWLRLISAWTAVAEPSAAAADAAAARTLADWWSPEAPAVPAAPAVRLSAALPEAVRWFVRQIALPVVHPALRGRAVVVAALTAGAMSAALQRNAPDVLADLARAWMRDLRVIPGILADVSHPSAHEAWPVPPPLAVDGTEVVPVRGLDDLRRLQPAMARPALNVLRRVLVEGQVVVEIGGRAARLDAAALADGLVVVRAEPPAGRATAGAAARYGAALLASGWDPEPLLAWCRDNRGILEAIEESPCGLDEDEVEIVHFAASLYAPLLVAVGAEFLEGAPSLAMLAAAQGRGAAH